MIHPNKTGEHGITWAEAETVAKWCRHRSIFYIMWTALYVKMTPRHIFEEQIASVRKLGHLDRSSTENNHVSR